jgi:rod shape-determining protein MreC
MRTVIDSKKPIWITLAAALIFHILLLSIQASRRVETGILRSWLIDSQGPMEKIVDVGIQGVENIWSGYIGLIHVRRDNEKLRSENDHLRIELSQKEEEVLELARLRQLMNLQSPDMGKTVVARIIGKDPSGGGQTITIDKGIHSGIQRDSAVMTRDGVVGRVIYPGKLFSVVQLIVDSQSAVGFVVRSSRRLGILKGNGSSELEMEYIDDDNDIKPGDELITSGQDQIYPKGLSLGVVLSVKPGSGSFKAVRIRPSVNLSHLEEVLCITQHLAEVPAGAAP